MQSKYMHVHQIVVISFLLHYVIVFSSGEGDVKTSCIRISLICPVSPKIDVLQISSHHSYSSLARVDASPIPSRVERSGSGVGGGGGRDLALQTNTIMWHCCYYKIENV